MIISILSKRTCIIQGQTASGKSKLIPLIAEMLGKNLLIYQINSDSGISILTGQNQINEELSEEEKTKLTNNLEQLKQFIKIENIENIKPRDIKKIIDEINLYINNNKENIEKVQKIKDLKKELLYIISPVNRFIEKESQFIESMKKGDWVLIDGIEYAPPHFSEKISTLCGEKKEFELFEYGEKYSVNTNINKNFHLYNPLSQSENSLIDQYLLNKCVSFTLPPIDFSYESSAQILYGIFRNNSYSKKNQKVKL